jgi:hypothetical protein
MPPALRSNTSSEPARATRSPRISRYTVLSKLQGGIRAEVLLGLPEDALELEKVVLIKSFFPHKAGPSLDFLTEELDLTGKLDHENIARTLSIGYESDRYFIVSEYLDGVTLRTLLRWATVSGVRLADSLVVRLLLALVDAVDHADLLAESTAARILVNQPVSVDDLFVTYGGDVKVLGFKSPAQTLGIPGTEEEPVEPSALDSLSSAPLSLEVSSVLASASTRSRARPCDRLWQIGQVLKHLQSNVIQSDGRAELVALMARVQPQERSVRRSHIEAAFQEATQHRTSRSIVPGENRKDAAPLSGFRRVAAGAAPRPSLTPGDSTRDIASRSPSGLALPHPLGAPASERRSASFSIPPSLRAQGRVPEVIAPELVAAGAAENTDIEPRSLRTADMAPRHGSALGWAPVDERPAVSGAAASWPLSRWQIPVVVCVALVLGALLYSVASALL